MTSRREQLGDTGSVEAGLGKTEGGTQTGTTGTDNDGIVLVILPKVRPHVLWERHPALFAYNHGVLVGDVAIGLLGAHRSIAEDAGWRRNWVSTTATW